MWALTETFARRAARTPALPAAACMHLALAGAFVLLWPDGLPVSRSAPLDQLRTLQLCVLCVLLPWVGVRASLSLEERDITSIAASAGTSSWMVLCAAILSTLATVLVVVGAGSPAVVLAQQFAGVPAKGVLTGAGSLIWIAAIAAGLSTLVSLRMQCPVLAWGVTAMITGGAVASASGLLLPPTLTAAAAAAIPAASLMFLRSAANRTMYLREEAS